MAAERLWEDGQPDFSSFSEFKQHTFRMADEFEGDEYTIYDDEGQPLAYLYFLCSQSWHRKAPGLDLSVLAIRSDAQSSRKVLATVRHIIHGEAQYRGLTWWSRVKHCGSVDVITTKEI